MQEHYRKNKPRYQEWARLSHKRFRRLQRGPTPLTVSQNVVRNIWLAQNKLCAICKVEIPFNAHMDHDHTTLKLRGMLCRNCNPGLGQFKHNPILLEAAAAYLRKYE